MFPFSEIATACECILFSSIKKIWLGVKKKKKGAALDPKTHIYFKRMHSQAVAISENGNMSSQI
jgi:hypothetical protein